MGFDNKQARGLLRVTLERFDTEYEVKRFLQILPEAVASVGSAENEFSYVTWNRQCAALSSPARCTRGIWEIVDIPNSQFRGYAGDADGKLRTILPNSV
jgi:hypothetical protein